MLKIKTEDTAKAIAALYNAAKVQGLGFLQAEDGGMTEEEAQRYVEMADGPPYFDYLKGRVMKVKVEELIDPTLYDRDNGPDAAATALLTAEVDFDYA